MTAVAQSFGFGEQLVRVIERDSGPWFVANDVCAALAIANPRDAIGKLDADERDCVGISDAIGRERQTSVVSEPGCYVLIMRCRGATTPGTVAHRFRRWFTHEVLPTIRRTGRYERPGLIANEDDGVTLVCSADVAERMATIAEVRWLARLVGKKAALRHLMFMGQHLEHCRDLVDEVEAIYRREHEPVPLVPKQPSGSMIDWAEARTVEARMTATPVKLLYADYERWCRRRAYRPVSIQAFRAGMNAAYGGLRYARGFGLELKSHAEAAPG